MRYNLVTNVYVENLRQINLYGMQPAVRGLFA